MTDISKSLEITKPTLLLDKKQVVRNIEKMVRKAEVAGVRLRPHFKTHQSAEIGNWFKNFGVKAITVSSLDMALYFANHKWSDITVAFIVNILEIEKINRLARDINLNLLVDSEHVVSELAKRLKHRVGIWIKIDVGYHRTGVLWNDFEHILTLIQKIESLPNFNFSGLLTHSGNVYQALSVDDIRRIHVQTVERLLTSKDFLRTNNLQTCKISIGDTPSCSLVNNFNGVDEIRPGNFVFYDLIQLKLGSCIENEIAVAVACPVVGKYEDRKQVVIYGGAVHLSKEFILDEDGRKIFGFATSLQDQPFGSMNRKARVISLNQEHGIVELDDKLLNEIEIGDILVVFPVHSCLTCNLYNEYKTLEGGVISRF